jgi:hypothetical protein
MQSKSFKSCRHIRVRIPVVNLTLARVSMLLEQAGEVSASRAATFYGDRRD